MEFKFGKDKRHWIEISWDPKPHWWSIGIGHGGDEYGNCSIYFRCLLGEIVIFTDRHYQDKVLLPNPGVVPWVDAKFWNEGM